MARRPLTWYGGGILLFTACSWWELGPVWWFAGVLAAAHGRAAGGRLRVTLLESPGNDGVSSTAMVVSGALSIAFITL